MKKAIVTGADGFIGRYLVKELLENDYEVYAIVLAALPARAVLGWHENLHCITCGMDAYTSLPENKELQGIPLLFHLAWAGVSDAGNADYNVQLNNARCACDLQAVAATMGVKRMVFADSIMEWEHMKAFAQGYYQVSLRNTYHVCKMAARNLLQLRANNTQMEFVPVVISNVYGVGENSPRLVNTAVRKLLAGEHMSFTAGEQMYDFIYITDAVRAIRLAAEMGENNKIYYIGNREQHPLKEFLTELRDTVAPGVPLGLGEVPYKGISLDYQELDTQALFEDCGFEPQVSFRDGVRRMADWIRGGVIRFLLYRGCMAHAPLCERGCIA